MFLIFLAFWSFVSADNSTIGRLCMTVEHFRVVPSNESHFLECSPLAEENRKEFGIEGKYLGVWTQRLCPRENIFDSRRQRCLEKGKSRHPSIGTINQTVCENLPIRIGRSCNWESAPLYADSQSSAFLQCIPISASDPCGEWNRVECPKASVFQISIQICVPPMASRQCSQQNQIAVCHCGQSNDCPGVSVCEGGVCCVTAEPVIALAESPICLGSGAFPISPCSVECPLQYSCQPNIGCCPAEVLCPGTSVTAVGSCGSCPVGLVCSPLLGSCCPSSVPSAALCPIECPIGSVCSNGGCCRCDGNSIMVELCPVDSLSCKCTNGCCCQERIQLPICQNGQPSTVQCSISSQCSPTMECINGGCCPLPFCPNGNRALGHCLSGGNCSPNGLCLNGLCCPLPLCSNGLSSSGFCSSNSMCGIGRECYNGGCCPQLPICSSSNQLAVMFCEPNCPSGTECVNGGCCPLPLCPTGAQSLRRCGDGCPVSTVCMGGLCCPQPVCSGNGQPAGSLCGLRSSCPSGYFCEGGFICCPEPLPLCPNRAKSLKLCIRGSDCPQGYGCSSNGGCCALSTSLQCPANSYSICQCSASDICPSGTSCFGTTCCASAPTVFSAPPGVRCEASPQCSGYSSGAECLQNICVCVKGTYSNGASCMLQQPIIIQAARDGCDQYGNPCRTVLSSARRKPILTATGNTTGTPLWYNVQIDRKCPLNTTDSDNTCLPNEKCINGRCKLRLWPGEYGCETDQECSSRCPNTFCEHRSDKDIPQCQCSSGFLLYGRCFQKCPNGFTESGPYCQATDENVFWTNSTLQQDLQHLLNKGLC